MLSNTEVAPCILGLPPNWPGFAFRQVSPYNLIDTGSFFLCRLRSGSFYFGAEFVRQLIKSEAPMRLIARLSLLIVLALVAAWSSVLVAQAQGATCYGLAAADCKILSAAEDNVKNIKSLLHTV